jgi:hypothetical protein
VACPPPVKLRDLSGGANASRAAGVAVLRFLLRG